MITVTDRDHLGDQAIRSDTDGFLSTDRAVVSEDGPRPDDELASTLDREVSIEDAALTERDLGAWSPDDRKATPNVATGTEVDRRPPPTRE